MRLPGLLAAAVIAATTTLTLPALPASAYTTPFCQDGLDDDGDGRTDMADPGCTHPEDPSERGTTVCDNGADDDGDGLGDAPADGGCAGPTDGNERRGTACDDGVDNDGDGSADYPLDGGCSSATDSSEACGETAPGVVACWTPGTVLLKEVVPVADVSLGAMHRVRGYVDIYHFTFAGTGTTALPCVVLTSGLVGGELNPCADAGGTFHERRLHLVDAGVQEYDVAVVDSAYRAGVCEGTYRVTVLGFGPTALPALSLC